MKKGLALISQRLATSTISQDDLLGSGASVARKRYSEGWTTLAQLREELRLLGYTEDDVVRQVTQANLEFNFDWHTDTLAALRAAFAKDVVTADQFLSQLATLGMDPDRATLYLELEQFKRAKRAESLTPAQVERAYSRRLLTQDQATQRLLAAGYTTQNVDLLLRLATLEPEAKEVSLSPSQVQRAYAAGLLTRDQASLRLRDANYDPEEISILLTLATLEPEVAVRRLTAREAVDALAKGLITDADYQRRMAALRYPPEDAWLLVKLAAKPPTPEELRQLSLAQLTSAYKAGLLPLADLRQRLLDQHWDEADADLIIQLSTQPPQALAARDLSPAQLIKAYQAGLLDLLPLLDRLVAQGYSEADARLLARLAYQEITEPVIKDLTPAQLLSLFKVGLISEQLLFQRLLAQGYSQDDANRLIAQASL